MFKAGKRKEKKASQQRSQCEAVSKSGSYAVDALPDQTEQKLLLRDAMFG